MNNRHPHLWISYTPRPIFLKPIFWTYSGGVFSRATISVEWLRHFKELAVGETRAPACFFGPSIDGGWLAQMALFHGHAAAALTDIFHGAQFIFAHMPGCHTGSSTKTAIGRISAGIAQMSRFVCYCTTILTSMCHCSPPCSM